MFAEDKIKDLYNVCELLYLLPDDRLLTAKDTKLVLLHRDCTGRSKSRQFSTDVKNCNKPLKKEAGMAPLNRL